MREIITLQLGHFSNYVATHFWNAQESYFTYQDEADDQPSSPIAHDVHWRVGLGADGSDTFLPRTVIYDLKRGFGSLRKINALYETPARLGAPQAASWDTNPVMKRLPPIPRSAYVESLDSGGSGGLPRLETSSVRYWSDFSRVLYHPRSVVQLHQYEVDSAVCPFDGWELGRELFSSVDKNEDMIDRDWRPFVEECDQMQGISVVCGLDDGWGGFAAAYLERLRDEYGKSCIWTWGLQDPDRPGTSSRERRRGLLANVIRSLEAMHDTSTVVVPLGLPAPSSGLPPSVTVDRSSRWHTSALVATGLESATLPSRMRMNNSSSGETLCHLGDLARDLNPRGTQPVAKLRLQVGSGRAEGDWIDLSNITSIPTATGPRSRAGGREGSGNALGRIVTSRGPSVLETESSRRAIPTSHEANYHCAVPFPQVDSFPELYAHPAGTADSAGLEVKTVLSTDVGLAGDFKFLRDQARALFEPESRERVLDFLAGMVDAYQDGWSSGSDEDDD